MRITQVLSGQSQHEYINLLFPAMGKFHSSHMPQGCRLKILILKPSWLLFFFGCLVIKRKLGHTSSWILVTQTSAVSGVPDFSETLLSPVFQQSIKGALVWWGNYFCPRTQYLKDRPLWDWDKSLCGAQQQREKKERIPNIEPVQYACRDAPK